MKTPKEIYESCADIVWLMEMQKETGINMEKKVEYGTATMIYDNLLVTSSIYFTHVKYDSIMGRNIRENGFNDELVVVLSKPYLGLTVLRLKKDGKRDKCRSLVNLAKKGALKYGSTLFTIGNYDRMLGYFSIGNAAFPCVDQENIDPFNESKDLTCEFHKGEGLIEFKNTPLYRTTGDIFHDMVYAKFGYDRRKYELDLDSRLPIIHCNGFSSFSEQTPGSPVFNSDMEIIGIRICGQTCLMGIALHVSVIQFLLDLYSEEIGHKDDDNDGSREQNREKKEEGKREKRKRKKKEQQQRKKQRNRDKKISEVMVAQLGLSRHSLCYLYIMYRENHHVSMGTEKWLHVELWDSTQDCFEVLKSRGYRIATTYIGEDMVSIYDMDWSCSDIVVGNENREISEEALKLSDLQCSIPMNAMVDSFNVTVAASILLHHAACYRTKRLPLQMIEKELAFSNAAKGSATSRPEFLSQRPTQSIHVNPKYLEARQRLQQQNRDAERLELDRAVGMDSGVQWPEPTLKTQITKHQRDAPYKFVQGKNIIAAYGSYDNDSDHSSQSGLETVRVKKSVFHKRPYVSDNTLEEKTSIHRNGLHVNRGFPNYSPPTAEKDTGHLLPKRSIFGKNGTGIEESWKSSDKEEYMWDDLNSKSSEQHSVSISQRHCYTPDESNRSSLENSLWRRHILHEIGAKIDREALTDAVPTEKKDQAYFRNRRSP